MDHEHPHRPVPFWRSRTGWIFLTFLAIAVYFLVMEHKAHLSGLLYYLPFALLLLCPLLHFFGHGGHGGESRKGDGHER